MGVVTVTRRPIRHAPLPQRDRTPRSLAAEAWAAVTGRDAVLFLGQVEPFRAPLARQVADMLAAGATAAPWPGARGWVVVTLNGRRLVVADLVEREAREMAGVVG